MAPQRWLLWAWTGQQFCLSSCLTSSHSLFFWQKSSNYPEKPLLPLLGPCALAGADLTLAAPRTCDSLLANQNSLSFNFQ